MERLMEHRQSSSQYEHLDSNSNNTQSCIDFHNQSRTSSPNLHHHLQPSTTPPVSSTVTTSSATSGWFRFFLLTSALAIYVVQSESLKYLQQDLGFYKPYFSLYLSNSCFSFVIPLQMIYFKFKSDIGFLDYWLKIRNYFNEFSGRSYWDLVIVAAKVATIFNSSQYCFYMAISRIPMADLTSIYNSSCFFAYLEAIWILGEKWRFVKFMAVIASIIGIALVSLIDRTDGSEEAETRSIVGYFVAIISSVFDGLYEVVYVKHAVPISKPPTIFFSIHVTGLIGLSTLVLGVIPIPLLHMLKGELFELPSSGLQWQLIALNAALAVAFNVVFMLMVTFLGPVTAAAGIMLTIPIVAMVDVFVNDVPLAWNSVVGSLFILAGFCLLSLGDHRHHGGNNSSSSSSLSESSRSSSCNVYLNNNTAEDVGDDDANCEGIGNNLEESDPLLLSSQNHRRYGTEGNRQHRIVSATAVMDSPVQALNFENPSPALPP